MILGIIIFIFGAILMFLAKVKWLSIIGLIIALFGLILYALKKTPKVPNEPKNFNKKE